MVSGYEIRVKLFNNFSIEIPETLPLINDILISNSYPLWFNSVDIVRVQNERIIFLAIFLSSHMQLLPASVQWNWWPTWWISYGLNSKIWTNNYECEKRAREVSADGVVWGGSLSAFHGTIHCFFNATSIMTVSPISLSVRKKIILDENRNGKYQQHWMCRPKKKEILSGLWKGRLGFDWIRSTFWDSVNFSLE